MTWDVIVVGARVAGAATARLLATAGLRVLCVDKVSFPKETISSHQLQLPGGALLRRWGLLERIEAAGTPPTRTIRFDPGGPVLTGRFPMHDGVDALYSPRRTLLDPLLIDAARHAGAEVREDVTVSGLIIDNGRVCGVRGKAKGEPFEERARIVVGADGKHSLVAAAVQAPVVRQAPTTSCAYYAYWRGLSLSGGEVYERPGRAVGVWPTNDGLVVTFLSARAADFPEFQRDTHAAFLRTFDTMGDLGDRIRAATLAERFRGAADLPAVMRQPFGHGWALVGDAGMTLDPITGQGMSQALCDAVLLSDAIIEGLGGKPPLDQALATYRARREQRARPHFQLAVRLSSFAPRPYAEDVMYEALRERPVDISQFLGILAGVVTERQFASPANAIRILGWRRLARIAAHGVGLAPARREAPTAGTLNPTE